MGPEILEGKYEADPNSGCWLWVLRLDKRGRPRLKVGDRPQYAYRVSYFVHKGDPAGFVVRHSCDTPACVNPAHLSLGTQADNIADRHMRGRSRGRSGPRIAMPEAARRDILENCRKGVAGFGVGAFARKYGLNPCSVAYVLSRARGPTAEGEG